MQLDDFRYVSQDIEREAREQLIVIDSHSEIQSRSVLLRSVAAVSPTALNFSSYEICT